MDLRGHGESSGPDPGPGAYDIAVLADDVLAAVKDGYAVATWYGPDSEALVVGYLPAQLAVSDGRR